VIEVVFHGQRHAGSLALDADGLTLFTCPADPDAPPHMLAAPADPTPDQADAMADALRMWAALRRAAQHSNAQPDLLVLLDGRP